MAKYVDSQIFVGDVYDLAAEIGKEFEKLIDVCGTETIRELMTKVIVTLEYLESSTVVVDRLQSELSEIKIKVRQLEYEKLERAEFRSKLDQELEIIEENWRKETTHLNSLVVKLQEENKRLSSLITEKDKHTPNECCKAFLTDEDLVVVQKLKELAEQYRGQLIAKDRELLEKANEVEKMQLDMDQLRKANKELSHRHRHIQKQMYTLVEEKSDLQANIQNQQKECQDLQMKLNTVVKENMDLSTIEGQTKLDLHGKLIISLDDPNRPRFTLDELRHILFERNDLKAKISDLEDELNLHKPRRIPSLSSLSSLSIGGDDDLPVQGPINKEPEDKLFPEKKKLGIRRFFPSVTWPKLI